ncbi:MAG: LytTR family DNA-binding domain-containing protein [Bacteroidia bacterium]|nr:LytTR family DNA-binding domain-containing protein [Bacteroidia bacterium]
MPIYLKRNLILAVSLLSAAFIYTLLIALITAADIQSIHFFFDAPMSIAGFSWLSLTIASFVDRKWKEKSRHLISNLYQKIGISFGLISIVFFVFYWGMQLIFSGQISMNINRWRELFFSLPFPLLISFVYLIHIHIKQVYSKRDRVEKGNESDPQTVQAFAQRLLSIKKHKKYPISVEEIHLIAVEEGLVFAFDRHNQKHLLAEQSLKKLEAKLDPQFFFRINRSELVHIDAVESYEPYFKDRLALQIVSRKEALYTSNNRSPCFKKWLC